MTRPPRSADIFKIAHGLGRNTETKLFTPAGCDFCGNLKEMVLSVAFCTKVEAATICEYLGQLFLSSSNELLLFEEFGN